MRIVDIIRKKRSGDTLTKKEVRFLVEGFWQDVVPDYQMAAFAMAVYFSGMEDEELAAWTQAMLFSGDRLDFSHVSKAKVDKHSTGGVGDKISLPLAPLVAACGVAVPMISGRGLGHTGGTLDKLESIPGMRTDLSTKEFMRLVEEKGLALGGQTEQICPADKRLYALRDVTATVESIPLIASSIMSKKLAEGIDGLVLDVKVGSGAFMKSPGDARILADTMIALGARMGTEVIALLTRMEEPIGQFVGNALEVAESIAVLKGQGPAKTRQLTLSLAEEMLRLGGTDPSLAAEKLDDGSALAKFEEIIEAQGGDPKVCTDLSRLPSSQYREPILSESAGTVQSMDSRLIGIASIYLGAGRNKKTDVIDPGVGIEMACSVGDELEAGQPICWLHHNGRGQEAAIQRIRDAVVVGEGSVKEQPMVIERRAGRDGQ